MTAQHAFVPASLATFLFALLSAHAAARQSAGARALYDAEALREAAIDSALRVVQVGDSCEWVAPNAARGLRSTFTAREVRLTGEDAARDRWSLGLSFEAFGRTEASEALSPTEPIAIGRRVEYRRGSLTEWYVNDERGLEQGFTIETPPAGEGPLQWTLSFERGWVAEILPGERDARFTDPQGGVAVAYGGLKAWDATRRDLGASLAVADGRLTIRVEDGGAVYPVHVDPWFEEEKLVSSDAASGDRFGFSVAIDGDTAVVGARNDTHSSVSLAGSAYVFVRNGPVWSEQQKLTASDPGNTDLFGDCVAISGDTIVVGADSDDHAGGANAGSAYVFTRTGTTWSQQQKLTASDAAASDIFGGSVGVSGDTLVVGASQDTHAGGTMAGSAYVFVRSGTVWSQQQKLVAADAATNDFLGYTVAISGETVVVSCQGDDHAGGANAGSAYVFVRSGTVWSEQQKLIGADTVPGDNFASAVAVDGDTALIGASFESHAGGNEGAAYVFVRSGTVWSEQQKLIASDPGDDRFGFAVDVSGDTAVVGAYFDTLPAGGAAGSANVFARSGTVWTEQQKLSASDAEFGANFGWSVAVSGNRVFAGALLDDNTSATDGGSVYVYVLCAPPLTYCTAGTTTNGCAASITVNGTPSLAATSGFTIDVTAVEGDKTGLVFYGISGPKAAVWSPGSSSYMCVKAPIQRFPSANSGGSAGDCDGSFHEDFLDYVASNPGALGQPLAAGTVCNAQAWFRDPPAPGTTNLSNGVQWSLQP